MKKYFWGLVPFVCFSVPAFADCCPQICCPAPSYFDGLYLGAGVGTAQGKFDTSSTSMLTEHDFEFDSTLTAEDNNSFNGHDGNVLGSFFVGYGKVFNNFYLGAEVFGNANKLETTNKGAINIVGPDPTEIAGNFSNDLKINTRDFEYGVDGRVGFLLCPSTLIYGRGGVVFNKLAIKSTNTFRDLTPDSGPIDVLDETHSKTVTGYRVGGGLEQYINSNWSLRTDYVYTNYGSINANSAGSFTPDDTSLNVITNSTNSKVSTNTFLVSVTYHFHC